MEIKDLEIIMKVYEYQNMTKTAQELFLSPQSVSNTILKLENEFNVILFERTTSGSLPTQEAIMLRANAMKLLNDFETVRGTFSGIYEKKKIVKVASTTGVFRYLTLDFLNQFYGKYPFIRLDIIEQLDPTVDELLWNDVVDVAFNSAPINHVKFDAIPFSSHKYCCILHKSHPLSLKDKIAYRDLKDEPLAIIGSFGYYLNKLEKENYTPNVVYKTIDITFLNEIAAANQGIGISIDYVARPFLGSNTVLRYFEDEDCTWDSMMITKKNKPIGVATQIFIDYALEYVKTIIYQ